MRGWQKIGTGKTLHRRTYLLVKKCWNLTTWATPDQNFHDFMTRFAQHTRSGYRLRQMTSSLALNDEQYFHGKSHLFNVSSGEIKQLS